MKDIIAAARVLAISEIEKYGSPKLEHFEISFDKGQELAATLGADTNIVALGTIFMDLKIGECLKEGKLAEHVARSAEAAREFLAGYVLADETIKKVISCVESHHGTDNYYCPEAEICANSDCYRFLSSAGFLNALILFSGRDISFIDSLDQAEKKMEEKFKILSLDICKQELMPSYRQLKEMSEKARAGL